MKTTLRARLWLTLTAALPGAIQLATAASQITFTDTWKDTAKYTSTNQNVAIVTSGSFNLTISLPLGGVDLTEADTNTFFTLNIGPAGSPLQIVADTLGDAEKYSAANKTATFPIIDPYSQATNGSVTVSWTATTLSVSGSATGDSLGEEQLFALTSVGTPTNFTFSTVGNGNYYEVSVGLDASDNGGGTFSFDQSVPVTGNDTEAEYTAPNGAGPYPLESGSIQGTGDFTAPKVSITGPPAYSKVYDTNPVVRLTGQASDNILVTDVECVVNGNTNNLIPIDQAGLLPTNSLAWTASVDLSQFGVAGTNLITVTAVDGSGNQASAASAFVWVSTRPPSLTLAYSARQVVVSWPASVSGWALQTNGSLAGGKWGAYAGPVVNNSATNPASAGELFFRLAHP